MNSRCRCAVHIIASCVGTAMSGFGGRAFEAAVIADYDAQSAVERELVLRLASLLWRIRRATTMETGLFDIQARQLLEFRRKRDAQQSLIRRFFPPADPNEGGESDSEHIA